MKLRDDDKKWFAEEIARQLNEVIESFKPHGWRKLVRLLRELGPLIGSMSLVVTLLGITLASVYYSISNVKEETQFRTNTKDKLEKLDTEMVSLRTLIASSQPLKNENQKAAMELLAQARQKLGPAIPQSVVAQAGNSFIEAAKADAKAWDIALDFASYRSSQNQIAPLEGYYPFDAKDPKNLAISRFFINFPPGAEVPRFTTSKARTPISQSARLEPIGQPQKQDGPDGPTSILGVGGVIILDGMYGRHVAFKDAEIHYNGGPLVLEEVMFVNCRFVVDNNDFGHQLASDILAAGQVTFKTKG